MKKTFLIVLAMLLAGGKVLVAQTAKPVAVKMQAYTAKKCARKESCVEFSFSWPVLTGGEPRAVSAINDSISSMVHLMAEADQALPLPVALDSSAAAYLVMLREQLANMEGYDMGYFNELSSEVLLNNGRYLSLNLSNSSFAGGAHPNSYTLLNTYDLSTGKTLPLTAFIRDTIALRGLLEKAFVAEHIQEGETAPKLSDLLFELPLALPTQYALVPKGMLFIYNPYEVAAYVFGPTVIELSWAQLERLADRKKWGL